jgi:transcriptional regulator with XRE-family HTH domain
MPSNQHAIRVGNNVRAELARRNESQGSLAERLNMTQQALSRRISGRQAFKVDELQRVADALEVPISDLYGTEQASA